MEKVKAHTNNRWNNKADELAVSLKKDIKEEKTNYLVKNIEKNIDEFYIWWRDHKIKGNIRKRIKDINFSTTEQDFLF